MTISTTLTIQNNSGCPIDNRGTPDYKDGALSGSAPATSIAAGSSTTFKIEQKNSVSPGPEGTVTYKLETGNEQVPLSFYWNYSSGAQHHESYTATTNSSLAPVVITQTDASGDNHATTYRVDFKPRAPHEWDLVWALSVGLINKQLHALRYYQLIPSSFTQAASGGAQLTVTAMGDPTVSVSDDQTTHLDVHLAFTTATLQYVESGATKTQDLSGTTVIVSLDLSQAQVTDPNTLAATSDAKQHIQGLQSLNYSVYRLFLDLAQPSLFRALQVVNASNQSVSLSQAAQSALQATLAGVGHMDVAYTTQAPGSPASIIPTFAKERTTRYSTNGNFSTLNVCMMSRGRKEPNWNSRFGFTAPLAATTNPDGTPAEARARLFLSQDTLGEGYLKPTVLPAILRASGIPGTISRLAPLMYQCVGSRDNSSKNDGRGEFVQVDNGFDQYVFGTETVVFTTQPNLTQTDRCTVAMNGQFQVNIEASQYPLDFIGLGLKDVLGKATYVQPWTGTITIAAGNGGKLVTSVTIVLGKAPAPDVDKTLDGWVFNALDKLFNWSSTSPQDEITQKAQDFANNLAATFQNNASMSLDVEDCVVLPTGSAHDYSQFVFNSEGAVQVDVSFPG
ncbi:hypothetical protein D7X99_25955 [Corallococcus sp. AB032C]|uniref:hypothetical protein n=1 Tax=Corallococcus TaxID=83461 RepID=UPI000EC42C1E|nr:MULTISPECIES: hypothetical protein [Corallococcus]NPC47629.1 hypothetical protein [Corallococcus exiguus]RKH79116.1 hypothetical protein D7X99_25955 [Corallococcus sp. AB032C]